MKISKEIKYAMIKTYIFRTPLVVERLRIQPPMQGKVKVKGAQSCLTLCDPMNYTVHGIPQARILERVAFPFSRGSSQPRSPALQADSLPAEPQGKPNTGVGSLSLLQGIFPTQEGSLALQADSLPIEL